MRNSQTLSNAYNSNKNNQEYDFDGDGELNKVFAECKDIENFDQQKVLEKALLKAFQNEIIKISVVKNSALKR